MSEASILRRENELLRERLSKLSEACLCINESVDSETVLKVALNSARALTGACYGVFTLLDDSGRIEDVLASGMTAEEAKQLWEVPEGTRLFEYLGSIEGPLRVTDLLGHMKSLGLPDFRLPVEVSPLLSFLAAPVLHRGERVGNIYLAGKEPGEGFTREDEETVVMFASQAAMVIANARRFREEQRAKADMESLVNNLPVGVAVFDATTGAPLLINPEAARIVDSLRQPEQSLEELLNLMTCRRADGREISLMEVSMAEALSAGETVRAEEIVLRVPDGRSVSALLDATPIFSQEGVVESFVMTLQDMTPMEDLERMRAEFLGTVSHELRTPLTSIRGSATTLLDDSSALHPAEMRQFYRIIVEQSDRMGGLISSLVDVARIETGTLPADPRAVKVTDIVDEARRIFLSGGGMNEIHIDLAGHLPLVMADPQRIVQVLGNLLSNAARYSPNASPIRVGAVREKLHVAFSVTDQGQGVPAERLPHLFKKFFRIASEDGGRELAGSGLGLAICKGIVEGHGGRIWAESEGAGFGTRFTFTIPVVEESQSSPAIGSAQPAADSPRTDGEQQRILAVDDDPRTLRYIRDVLSKAGYAPIVTGDPHEVFSLMEASDPQLVLLDLMLPGTDGIKLMQEILEMADVPVIFLSAYGQEEYVTRAFDLGAVDYIVKPFAPMELAARIRAALRKSWSVQQSAEPYLLRDLSIDYAQRSVTVAGRPVELTPIEYRLLYELSVNAGRVLTHDYLLRRIWGPEYLGYSQPVRSFVKKLRHKLGDDPKSPMYIYTQPRVGYRMEKGY